MPGMNGCRKTSSEVDCRPVVPSKITRYVLGHTDGEKILHHVAPSFFPCITEWTLGPLITGWSLLK